MIRWVFYMQNGYKEGLENVCVEVRDMAEDERLREAILKAELLFLPGAKTDLWVRLEYVKCISREIVDEPDVTKPTPTPEDDHLE